MSELVFMLSSLVDCCVLDFFERQNFVGRRLLNVIDPAAVVINSVAATTGDVEVNGTETRQLIARGVTRCRSENGAFKLTTATTIAYKSGGTVPDHENDSIPPGVTVIRKV